MKVSVILAHPDKNSFNHAIASAVTETLKLKNHDIYFHDLYAEIFDAVLPAAEFERDASLPDQIKKHCSEIAAADGIVIIHPNWWGQPPAILKGWVDRVIRPGVAYEFLEGDKGEGIPKGLLKARIVAVFNTSNTAAEREKNVFKDPLETLWKNCVFGLCGVMNFYRRMFNIIITSTEEERRAWLNEVRQTIAELFNNIQERKI